MRQRSPIDFRSRSADGSTPYPRVSFYRLFYAEQQALAGETPVESPDRFTDKIVVVGATASALDDVFTVPTAGKVGGLEVHAAVVDSILSGRTLAPASRARALAFRLTGVAVDPQWPTRPFIYVYYDHIDGTCRIERYTAEGDLNSSSGIYLTIDPASREVTIDGQTVGLRAREFDLLLALADHTNQVLSRDQLLDLAWGIDYYGQTRTVDVHIGQLRDRLEGSGVEIETVWGRGYKLSFREEAG